MGSPEIPREFACHLMANDVLQDIALDVTGDVNNIFATSQFFLMG